MVNVGEWVAWQCMTSRGPGRWSIRHYTKDGRKALCGRKIPEVGEVFRRERGTGHDNCIKCSRKLTATFTLVSGEG